MAQFLPLDAAHFMLRLYQHYKLMSLIGSLLLWSLLTALLSQRFHRRGMDIVVFALVVTITLLFVSACVYLLCTQPGYHF